MTPDQEAAAFWGSAQNEVYSVKDRLAMALQALEFFGKSYERLEALMEDRERAGKTWGQESEWASIEIRDIRSALEGS
jgi:hypothetical protein